MLLGIVTAKNAILAPVGTDCEALDGRHVDGHRPGRGDEIFDLQSDLN